MRRMRIVVFGLSLSSSWGNGHATTYRALLRALAERGHDILFLERETPWYASQRDLIDPPYCRLVFYPANSALDRFAAEVAQADAVIVGSFVPDGVRVGEWVLRHARGARVFYDIDTPVTLSKLARGDYEYIAPALIPRYDLYLSFTSGPTLRRIETELGAPAARALYCSVDAEAYRPQARPRTYALGYLGTYSPDRQPTLDNLLIAPARQRPDLDFIVAGAQFPADIDWPANVVRIDHVPPSDHPRFYASLRLALNVTRADMMRIGFSPSVRLFEAAACGTPVISDHWPGIDTALRPGTEILIAQTSADVLAALERSDAELRSVAEAARARVLAQHTARHRARELEEHLLAAIRRRNEIRETEAPAVLQN